jgi:hypothetical protein
MTVDVRDFEAATGDQDDSGDHPIFIERRAGTMHALADRELRATLDVLDASLTEDEVVALTWKDGSRTVRFTYPARPTR